MDDPSIRGPFISNERVAILVNYLLVSAMLTCFMISLTQFTRVLVPNWENGYLPYFAFVVSLDALYIKRATKKMTFPNFDWFALRISEVVVILFAVKIFLYILRDPNQLILDISTWREDFIPNFFSGEYLAVSFLVLLVWVISRLFASDLEELEVGELFLDGEVPLGSGLSRQIARDNMVSRVFFLGAMMIVLAAFIRIDLQSIGISKSRLHPSAVNILLYFFFSLVLMSQTQFSILRAEWSHQRLRISEKIGVRWAVYSILFLLGVSGLVVLLPTRYTLGFLAVLNYLLELLMSIILFLWGSLIYLFLLFLSLLGFGNGETNPVNIVPPKPIPPEPSNLTTTPLPWFEFIKSFLFWVIFIGVVVYSGYQFLSQHQELLSKLQQIPGWANVHGILKRFIAWLRGINNSINKRIETRFRSQTGIHSVADQESPRFIGLRRLSPRQKILFFYLALIRRGREKGLQRQTWQTPYEYGEKLREQLPEVDEDLLGMTETFVEARYSPHIIPDDRVGFMRRWWLRVRKALRR